MEENIEEVEETDEELDGGCDCSHCHHHCGCEEEDDDENEGGRE